MQIKKPKCTVLEEDITSMIGKVSRTLKDAGQYKQATKMNQEILKIRTYDDIFKIFNKYVEIR